MGKHIYLINVTLDFTRSPGVKAEEMAANTNLEAISRINRQIHNKDRASTRLLIIPIQVERVNKGH